MKVTDEMVERAMNAIHDHEGFDIGSDGYLVHDAMRAALESVLRDLPEVTVPDEIGLELCAPISLEWMARRTGYREGWNACRKAMLSAAPTPPRGGV